MLDQRRGVPSASGMWRTWKCPGSHKMCQQAPKRPSGKDADVGQLTHNVLGGEVSADNVPYSVAQTAEMCEEQTQRLLEEWLQEGEEPVELKEVRYGLTTLGGVVEVTPESRATFVFTGQYDRLYISGTRGFLGDFKALYGTYPKAIDNPQLASLAPLVWRRHKLTSLRVCLIQPWRGKPSVCDYDAEAIAKAEAWVDEVLTKERNATPEDRSAGPWCVQCDAAAYCDTFKHSQLQQIEVIDPMTIAGMDGETQRRAMFARAMELRPEQLTAAYCGLPMMKRYVDAIEGALRAQVESGANTDFQLVDQQGDREVGDAQKAFEALSKLGLTEADMLAAATLSVTKLDEAVRKRSGIKSQTAKRTCYNLTADGAKDALARALGPLLSYGATKKKLVPVTPALNT